MSVKTNTLIELIEDVERELVDASNANDSTRITELQNRKAELVQQLHNATPRLNEGKQQLLKD